jgi:hypothetical protein
MAFWASFESHDLHRYVEWHNCEHLAERVSIPGFQTGRRYRVDGVDGRFLQFYETKTSSILATKREEAVSCEKLPKASPTLKSKMAKSASALTNDRLRPNRFRRARFL